MISLSRLLIPLFWYLAIALGIPLLNGAHVRPEFWVHATWVAAVPASLLVCLAVTAWLRRLITGFRDVRSQTHHSHHQC